MFGWIIAVTLMTDPTLGSGQTPKRESTASAVAQEPARSGPSVVAVTLECTARASGAVQNCIVLEETHPGLGFGEAALVLMKDARVPAGDRDIQFARTIQFTP